ncbi:MAG: hypothetical protein RR090_12160 [Niameybacter sp.]
MHYQEVSFEAFKEGLMSTQEQGKQEETVDILLKVKDILDTFQEGR